MKSEWYLHSIASMVSHALLINYCSETWRRFSRIVDLVVWKVDVKLFDTGGKEITVKSSLTFLRLDSETIRLLLKRPSKQKETYFLIVTIDFSLLVTSTSVIRKRRQKGKLTLMECLSNRSKKPSWLFFGVAEKILCQCNGSTLQEKRRSEKKEQKEMKLSNKQHILSFALLEIQEKWIFNQVFLLLIESPWQITDQWQVTLW